MIQKFLKKYSAPLVLCILVSIILGTLFYSRGGILLLDYIATPYDPLDFSRNLWFSIPQLFVPLIGYEWASKGVFIAILLLSGWLGVLWVRYFFLTQKWRKLLEVLGMIFFLCNPFAYERMLTQPVIYLSIILLGYGIYFLLKKRWIWFGVCAGLALNLSLHTSFMIFVIIFGYICFFVRKKSDWKGLLVGGIFVCLCNINWILAPLFANDANISVLNTTINTNTFDIKNFEAFMTNELAPLNVWWTNILLYGFWGERYTNHFINVTQFSHFWYIFGICFFVLVLIFGVIGIWKASKKQPYNIWQFIGFICFIGVLSLVFAVGIASPLIRGFTEWMVQHIPFWQGYREPQKWTGMLMLAEGILSLLLVGLFWRAFYKYTSVVIGSFALLVCVFYFWSPGTLFGYQGQLRTTVYPEEFYTVRQILSHRSTQTPVLVLPWHSYMGCQWTGRPSMYNPMGGFLYPIPAILPKNIEVGQLLYTNTGFENHPVETFLQTGNISVLTAQNIDTLLLMKECGDAALYYNGLTQLPGCAKISEGTYYALYNCK